MRLAVLWATCCLTLPAVGKEYKPMELDAALTLFTQIPECARECINLHVSTASTCAPLDLQCTCDSKAVKKGSQKCILDQCTKREALVTKNTTQTICGRPVRDRSPTVRLSSGIYMSVAAASYIIRICSKIHIQWPWNGPFRCITQLWWDDVAMTVTFLFALSQSALGRPISTPGLGMDVWTLTPAQITRFAMIFFYGELLYVTGLSMVKTSMLLSYLRFFASPKFRKLVWLVIGLNFLFMLLYDSLAAFQCIPVSYTWKEWDNGQGHVGHCWLDRQAAAWTASAFNIVFDLIVLGMPIPLIWKMDMDRRKKILVILMFGAGVWVTLISILRLHVMIYFGNTLNPTWDYDWIARWSTIEVDFWVLAACMPGIRNFAKRWRPEAVGETTKAGVESIQPGLYEPHRRSSRRSTTSDVDEYVQNLEYFRIPEMNNAAAARNLRMGMLWSRASVDLDQLGLAGWNVNNRLATAYDQALPLDATLNGTAPVDALDAVIAPFANATAPLPPLDPDEERKSRITNWLMFWRRRGSPYAPTWTRSSRSEQSQRHKTTILSSRTTGDDIALSTVTTPIRARVTSTLKSLETVTSMEMSSDAASDHKKDFRAL